MSSILVNGPVTVPADFCSHHTKWPGTGTKPTGATIGNIRLLDGSTGWMWRHIETSAGVYSWTNLDTMIAAYRTEGWTVSFAFYGTPVFYASAGDQGFNDQYNNTGGAAYPTADTNLAGAIAFVTALITRYNDAGGTWRLANPTLGKGIQTFEVWNEPNFSQNHSGYWWGTAGQLIDLTYSAYASVKAVDPSVTVMSPGFFNDVHAWPWITAKGTINTTKTGADTCDALSFHGYLGMPYGAPYCAWFSDIAWGQYGAYPFVQMASRFKPGADVYCTEYGFDTSAGTASLLSLARETADFRYTLLARVMLTLAAMGVKRFGCYAFENTLCGDWVTDTNGVIAAYNLVGSICGKTIISATAEIKGPLTLRFSDNTSLSV